MAKNKYVDFVSDKDFIECVKWVCDAYPAESEKIDMKELQRNTIDPFKMVFDVINGKQDVGTWIKNEMMRQHDKTLNNKIGEFHQKLLGKVKGWTDLGVGDESKVDLKNDKNTIFIELKNKFNTMNSDATDKCREKLENSVTNHPSSVAYWAFIISQDGTSGESIWVKDDKNDPRIKKIWGKKVYELVTGDSEALSNVWSAIPLAIEDVLNSKFNISKEDKDKLIHLFKSAFKD